MNPYCYRDKEPEQEQDSDVWLVWIAVLAMLYMVAQTARAGLIEVAKLM